MSDSLFLLIKFANLHSLQYLKIFWDSNILFSFFTKKFCVFQDTQVFVENWNVWRINLKGR